MTDSVSIDGLDYKRESDHQQDCIQKLLDEAAAKGATAAEVSIGKVAGLSVQSRKSELETVEFNHDCGLSLTVYVGQSKGSVSSSDLSESALSRCLQSALDIAKYTAEDAYAGLADAERMAQSIPDLALDYPADISMEHCIEQAITCETTGMEMDSRIINSDGASFSSHRSVRSYGNSHGFLASMVGTKHSMSCALIGKEKDHMHRDGWYSYERDVKDLETAKAVGEKAALTTLKHLSPRKINTMKVPVIFDAEISAGFFGHLFSAISGGSLYRKASFLLDHLGQSILPDFIDIEEDPLLPKGFSSSAFDSEGVATSKHHLVEGGCLVSYVLGSYSARRLGMQSTGNAGGLRNVTVSHGGKSQAELLKTLDKGVLITDVMGQGVNTVTGDYSRGAEGFWVENGEIQYPITEFTVAGNLKDMFKNIAEIGADWDRRKSTRCGSILMSEVMLAGSDA